MSNTYDVPAIAVARVVDVVFIELRLEGLLVGVKATIEIVLDLVSECIELVLDFLQDIKQKQGSTDNQNQTEKKKTNKTSKSVRQMKNNLGPREDGGLVDPDVSVWGIGITLLPDPLTGLKTKIKEPELVVRQKRKRERLGTQKAKKGPK